MKAKLKTRNLRHRLYWRYNRPAMSKDGNWVRAGTQTPFALSRENARRGFAYVCTGDTAHKVTWGY